MSAAAPVIVRSQVRLRDVRVEPRARQVRDDDDPGSRRHELTLLRELLGHDAVYRAANCGVCDLLLEPGNVGLGGLGAGSGGVLLLVAKASLQATDTRAGGFDGGRSHVVSRACVVA